MDDAALKGFREALLTRSTQADCLAHSLCVIGAAIRESVRLLKGDDVKLAKQLGALVELSRMAQKVMAELSEDIHITAGGILGQNNYYPGEVNLDSQPRPSENSKPRKPTETIPAEPTDPQTPKDPETVPTSRGGKHESTKGFGDGILDDELGGEG